MYSPKIGLSTEELRDHLGTLDIAPEDISTTIRVLNVIYMHRYLFSYKDFQLGELRDILNILNKPYSKDQKKLMRAERKKASKLQKNEHDDKILSNTIMKKRKDEEKKRIIMKFPNQKLVSFLTYMGTTTESKEYTNKILEVEWDPEYKDFEEALPPGGGDEDYSLRMDLVNPTTNVEQIKKDIFVKSVGLHANEDVNTEAAVEVDLVREVEGVKVDEPVTTINPALYRFKRSTPASHPGHVIPSQPSIEPTSQSVIFSASSKNSVSELDGNATSSKEDDPQPMQDDQTPNDSSENKAEEKDDEPMIEVEKEPVRLRKPRKCYCCKQMYDVVHFFYDAMCVPCGDFNYRKRIQSGDLSGRVALVTGARVKIGYCVVLKLIRAGATVIATTRFPKDAARRYSKEKDYDSWKDRLVIYGLDLRHTPSVHYFCNFIKSKYNRLDILINNAAQTLKRKPNFYAHLLPIESQPLEQIEERVQSTIGKDWTMRFEETSAEALEMYENNKKSETPEERRIRLSQPIPNILVAKHQYPHLSESALLCQVGVISAPDMDPTNFPEGALDLNGEQIDYSDKNTWVSEIDDIGYLEFMEVQTINVTGPWILIKELKPIMSVDQEKAKYIVNVSAMEGKFYRQSKTSRHPHTNMSKAALNMLTRTCGQWFATHNIYMNSVDTGFNTNELPVVGVIKNKTVPLDEEDGAARILDPVFDGERTGQRMHSQFFKDYRLSWW